MSALDPLGLARAEPQGELASSFAAATTEGWHYGLWGKDRSHMSSRTPSPISRFTGTILL